MTGTTRSSNSILNGRRALDHATRSCHLDDACNARREGMASLKQFQTLPSFRVTSLVYRSLQEPYTGKPHVCSVALRYCYKYSQRDDRQKRTKHRTQLGLRIVTKRRRDLFLQTLSSLRSVITVRHPSSIFIYILYNPTW